MTFYVFILRDKGTPNTDSTLGLDRLFFEFVSNFSIDIITLINIIAN